MSRQRWERRSSWVLLRCLQTVSSSGESVLVTDTPEGLYSHGRTCDDTNEPYLRTVLRFLIDDIKKEKRLTLFRYLTPFSALGSTKVKNVLPKRKIGDSFHWRRDFNPQTKSNRPSTKDRNCRIRHFSVGNRSLSQWRIRFPVNRGRPRDPEFPYKVKLSTFFFFRLRREKSTGKSEEGRRVTESWWDLKETSLTLSV